MGVSGPGQFTDKWFLYLLRLLRCAVGAATLHYGHHLCRRSTRYKRKHGPVSDATDINA
jgi:hypothetical protein